MEALNHAKDCRKTLSGSAMVHALPCPKPAARTAACRKRADTQSQPELIAQSRRSFGSGLRIQCSRPADADAARGADASPACKLAALDSSRRVELLGLALQAAQVATRIPFPSLEMPAISLVAINESPAGFDFVHAGLRFGEMFFSGSLPKVAAMYAAFELRCSVNALAPVGAGAPAATAFAHLRAQYDAQIKVAAPLISAVPTLGDDKKLPKYESVFVAVPLTGGGFAFEFSGTFLAHMRAMIVQSNNASAGACVKALGYSWLNGALERGGFFHTPSRTGIWLAGTYGGGWPAVRVPCANDVDTAQGMTCFDTARLYAHLIQGTLCSRIGDSSGKMLELLAEAERVDPSFIDPDPMAGRGVSAKSYEVTHTKIGIGPRTAGDVLSEATILRHKATGRRFIVVLQNIPSGTPLEMPAMLVDVAINTYLAVP